MNGYYLYRNAWRYDGPPDKEKRLNKKETKALLKKGGLLVRNTYDFDLQEETLFWYVIKDCFGGLDELPATERNRVRRAQNTLRFELVSPELIRQQGWGILKATYEDYAVADRKMDEKVFQQYLDHCSERQFDYWGVFDQERLIGFCTVWLWSVDSCEYGLIGILPEYKHNNTYPYYGLFYRMNEYYLAEKGFHYVTDGARSITEHSHIQEELIKKFRFRKAYCRLQVHYNWWMKIAVKILYPFRGIITIPQVKAILNMERMAR